MQEEQRTPQTNMTFGTFSLLQLGERPSFPVLAPNLGLPAPRTGRNGFTFFIRDQVYGILL